MLAATFGLQVALISLGTLAVLAAIFFADQRHVTPGAGPVVLPPQAPQRPVVLRLGPPSDAASERRAMTRMPRVRPAIVRRANGDEMSGPARRTFALDVGPGGALVAGPADLALGDELDISLDIGEDVAARARVVRLTPEGLKGLRFERVDAAGRAALERYVTA